MILLHFTDLPVGSEDILIVLKRLIKYMQLKVSRTQLISEH